MPNYYEILDVQPAATLVQIEAAYEAQYNQWRRLVTHHDPNIVNQANQALQTLETIRTTLTDPAKRSVYDAGIGIGGGVGGLVDLDAIMQRAGVMTPPLPAKPTTTAGPAPAKSKPHLWTCPSCATENPIQTKFCFKCGAQLVRECPECRQMTSLIATGYCGQCGFKYEIAAQRVDVSRQLKDAQERAGVLSQQLQSAQSEKSKVDRTVRKTRVSLYLNAFLAVGATLAIDYASKNLSIFGLLPLRTNRDFYIAILVTLSVLLLIVVVSALRLLFRAIRLTSSLRRRNHLAVDVYNLSQELDRTQLEKDSLQQRYAELAAHKSGE